MKWSFTPATIVGRQTPAGVCRLVATILSFITLSLVKMSLYHIILTWHVCNYPKKHMI